MVDFKKLAAQKTRKVYVYRCEACGVVERYLAEMRGELGVHRPLGRRGLCG